MFVLRLVRPKTVRKANLGLLCQMRLADCEDIGLDATKHMVFTLQP